MGICSNWFAPAVHALSGGRSLSSDTLVVGELCLQSWPACIWYEAILDCSEIKLKCARFGRHAEAGLHVNEQHAT
jgi:hypothetical protein